MECLSRWRSWIRPLVVAFYIVATVLIVPFLVVEFQLNGVQKHLQAWFIGGIFVLLAIPISLWGVTQHLIHYTQPKLQRYIIRILWMVPIYAADAWFALRFKEGAIYLDTIRECYEAYVLYNFMGFLLQYLTTEYPNLYEVLEMKSDVSHLIPFCWLPKMRNGRQFVLYCKHFVLQYTVVRPITTVIALITQFCGAYHEGQFSGTSAWLYLVLVNSFSQGCAMYFLVLFYQGTKEELRYLKPIPKFLCIKAIVFFTFWQQVIIAFLVFMNVIPNNENKWPGFSARDIATGLNDLIICIEMFLFAVFHYFSFSHKPYVDYALGYQDWCQSFRAMWDVSDVRDDVVDHVRTVGTTATGVVTRPLRKKPNAAHEKTPLLADSNAAQAASEITITGASREDENLLRTDFTPPVNLEISDYYDIESGQKISNPDTNMSEGAVGGAPVEANPPFKKNEQLTNDHNIYLGDKPLIDFASDSRPENTVQSNTTSLFIDNTTAVSDQRGQHNASSVKKNSFSEELKQPIQTENTHEQQQLRDSRYSVSSVFDDNEDLRRPSISSSVSSSKHLQPASGGIHHRSDDSVSTHTFDSASDVTDISIKRADTGSMSNYANFSDADSISHVSQKSEVNMDASQNC